MKLGCLSLNLKSLGCIVDERLKSESACASVPPEALSVAWILEYIYVNPNEDIFQKNIEQNFRIARSAASKMLVSLEKLNLIKRYRVSHDARLKKLVLTDAGRSAAEAVHSESKKLEKEILGSITPDEARCFLNVLGKLSLSNDNA